MHTPTCSGLIEAKRKGVGALGLVDEGEALFLLDAGQSLQAQFLIKPTVVSLLPLSPVCKSITSSGVRWPLQDATLRQNQPGGISNRLAEGSRSLKVCLGSGCLGIYFCWNEDAL